MKAKGLLNTFLILYQIIGGFIGVGIVIWIFTSILSLENKSDMFLDIVLTVIALFLFLFSIYCGLVLSKNLERGLKLSRINQIFQFINFSILGVGFKYIAGFYVTAGINLATNALLLKWGLSSYAISLQSSAGISEVHINFVAVVLIILIERLIKQTLQNDEEEKLDFQR